MDDDEDDEDGENKRPILSDSQEMRGKTQKELVTLYLEDQPVAASELRGTIRIVNLVINQLVKNGTLIEIVPGDDETRCLDLNPDYLEP
jgi:hypothetical protein